MHPLFQIFCICKIFLHIFSYSTFLNLFRDKYMKLGSSIWGVVGLSQWNGTVSAFCRQNANSFRKSGDLQPLLGLGAPAPYISHLVAYQIQPFSLFLTPVAMKSKNVLFMFDALWLWKVKCTFLCLMRSGCWDLMLACFELKQVSWKVSCLQQFIGQSWLLKSLKMEKGGLGRCCCSSSFSCTPIYRKCWRRINSRKILRIQFNAEPCWFSYLWHATE